ncbi:MAG: CDP-alcohol phosphatidyltransferase [Kangiella sp.]|nr:MAG: CDP-alcohol phosphatidyltransferase [Kangiella sp.]
MTDGLTRVKLTRRSIPNIITSIRLFLLIPLSFYLSKEDYTTALYIFFIAGFSDALDGYLAKKYNWTSHFGSVLDPLADKALLVISMAILTLNSKIDFLLFSLVVIRDVYIVFGAYLYHRKFGKYQMKPSIYSKLNTFFQISMVTLLLLSLGYQNLSTSIFITFNWIIYLTLFISTLHYTIIWGGRYFSKNSPSELRQHSDK